MKPIALLSLCCSIVIAIFCPTCAQETGYTPAKLINERSKFGPQNKTYATSRKEGWAFVDYTIDEQGKVSNLTVSASSEKYQREGWDFVEAYTYSPATYNAPPIMSSNDSLIDFSISFAGNNNNGMHPTFAKRFEAIKALVMQKEFAQAKSELDTLTDENAKNTTEQALSAWLQSLYYYNTQEWALYEKSLYEASYLASKLPKEMASMALDNLMKLQIHNKQFSNARNTLIRLGSIEGNVVSKETISDVDTQFSTLIEQHASLEINGVLHAHRSWRHQLNKSKFSLSSVGGSITSAALYCQQGFTRFDPEHEIVHIIPSNAGVCTLSVQGEPNTVVQLIESGESRYFMAL